MNEISVFGIGIADSGHQKQWLDFQLHYLCDRIMCILYRMPKAQKSLTYMYQWEGKQQNDAHQPASKVDV